MAFEFPLAAVLRIRAILEEREERLLQQIASEIGQTVEKLERTAREINASYASLGREADKLSVGYEIHAAYGEVKELTQARKDLEARLEKLQELRDKQRLVYEAARRDREMLTDMRQEKQNAHDAETARREQKILDDHHIATRYRS